MTAPAPVPDGTAPPAEAVEALIGWQVGGGGYDWANVDHDTAVQMVRAVIAALRLPERDRETAAKAWDEGAVRGLQTADWEYGARTNMPDQTNPYRTSALRERRES